MNSEYPDHQRDMKSENGDLWRKQPYHFHHGGTEGTEIITTATTVSRFWFLGQEIIRVYPCSFVVKINPRNPRNPRLNS